ncbi:MAG TPA: DUF1990 domain-containing protein, partial [Gemmataceae bacterium]|nr:DUF1990 domain-containing protein [Gemmataceae bacterium]
MLTFRRPGPETIREFLAQQRELPLAYSPEGMTRGPAPGSYNLHQMRHRLGAGVDVFERARTALRSWIPFQQSWVRLDPVDAELKVGTVVAITGRVGPCWWLNACRVVYQIDEDGPPRRFGFANGTLPGHALRGEERLCVELAEDGEVFYHLLAYSRPRHWLAWLGYPLLRVVQRRFAEGSAASLQKAAGVLA